MTAVARRRTAAVAAVAFAAATAAVAVAATWAPLFSSGLLGVLVGLKFFFSTATFVLLCGLLATYGRVYRAVPTAFSRALVLFTVALLLYAVTSNPLLPLVFGFGAPRPVGPFTFLPDLFASVAVLTLTHQSNA